MRVNSVNRELPEIEWTKEQGKCYGSRAGRKIAGYFDRPFISWDGEGITYSGNPQQCYVLFAASTGDYIKAREGYSVSTQQCFDLLFRIEEQYPNAIHVGFGFGYDTNQILNSLSRRDIFGLAQCTKKGYTYRYGDYRIKIHPGKIFRVSTGDKEHDNFRCVTIYDTFGFFQRKFLDVVKTYFPDELDKIESGKANRGSFEYSEIESITKYCLAENLLLVKIMGELRDKFAERGLYLRDWYGPGAVASASLKKHNIRSAMGDVPKDVSRAARIAYQGGRFELLRAGYHKSRVWQYDINSAYPSAITNLPDLSKGTWELVRAFEPGTFGIWRCNYKDNRTDRWDRYSRYRAEPLFYRTSDGRVTYPPYVEGWYWTPEAELLSRIDWPSEVGIIEGWVFRPETNKKPFKYVEDIYYERLEMKKRGDGTERCLKLEMNSLYGKFAQRSGWFKPGDRIPSYHQLEWAGYITASTRAKLWQVYNNSPGSIFSFETDALFSTRKLDLPVGEGLGEWSETIYDDILYIQSGFYFAHHNGGDTVNHYRGFDKGSLTFERVYEWLNSLDQSSFGSRENPKLYGPTKRFIGFKRALLSRNPRYWRTWDTNPREITIGRDGKRIHLPGCPLCIHGKRWTEGLHGLSTVLPGGISNPHKIPWTEDIWIENQWGEEKEVEAYDGYEV